jgi:hypothetical protein
MGKVTIEVYGIKLEKEINDKYAYKIYKELTSEQNYKEETDATKP